MEIPHHFPDVLTKRFKPLATQPLMGRLRGANREAWMPVTVGWVHPQTRTSADDPL